MRALRLIPLCILFACTGGITAPAHHAAAADGNRLTYLDDVDPYYVSRKFPKLITPQWVGEDGVEAVVILAIDDMKDSKKYEDFLRPIMNRLKKIDGRAALSIMSCSVKPDDPQLQAWLKEGVSLETHTFDHPCPLLKDGDFAKAKATYDRAVDMLSSVPGNKPVAFRTPCCDSLNTLSPRFFPEIFNKRTEKGNFLSIDSSVFNIFTANDPELPRELVLDPDGRERFCKYVPADRSFVNTIEDYPYPYVVGKLCWQFPCVTPSDWAAQNYHKPNNPVTVNDWKAALDCTIIKQGVYCLVFHPHEWIKNEQIVDLIDYAVTKHGKKVKFLTFKEAEERLTKNCLGGVPLRDPKTGQDNGVRVRGGRFSNDPYVMVGIQNTQKQELRVWDAKKQSWRELDLRGSKTLDEYQAFKGFNVFKLLRMGDDWVYLAANDKEQAVILHSPEKRDYVRAPFTLPPGAPLIEGKKDNGLRFVDLDEDGHLDIVWSNEDSYGIYLFKDMKEGWSRKVLEEKRDQAQGLRSLGLPMISRNGENMGFFVHSRHLWWQNENTNLLPNLVDRRSFNQILEKVDPGAKSPAASAAAMKARPGFVVEQVAAEPLVMSCIAFAWGPDGKLWVVEMADYPLGIDGKGKPGGRIKYLESSKNDGKYDKMTLFLDNVPFPTNVMPWRNGVIVSAAPNIFYAECTTGSGKADQIVPLFTGFREGNPQHRINGLAWGLDNWLYCANGDSGGKVKSVKTGAVVDISGRDVRIRPDSGEIDLQAGQSQYGRSRDDWGNWFGNNNSFPMWHYALDDYYIRRNKFIAAPNGNVQISVTPGAATVYPVSRTLPRFNDPHAANHFTSACSAIVYRDDLFGPNFVNNTFVSEPVHNLVHREIMTANGTTFTSRRAVDEQKSEFLASTDNWTRPCMINTGPDGALWVADMYRYVIEHPEWIPKEWQAKLNLRAGEDMGRIYRVYPVGTKPRAIPRLDKLDTAGLVAALDSPSGWQRDMAQMMLLWRNDKAAVPLLEKMTTNQNALARLHALCTLDGLQALRPEIAQRALADSHPGVRRHAIRVSEPLLPKSPELGAAFVKLLDDADPQVQMQLAYTLGEWKDPRAGKALGQLALKSTDKFLSAAVMSSVNRDNLDQVLLAVLMGSAKPQAALVENLLRLASALQDNKALATLLNAVATPDKDKGIGWQFTSLAGLLDALDQRNMPLAKLDSQGDAGLKAAIGKVSAMFETARATLADKKASRADQLLAVRLLGRGLDHQTDDMNKLADLLTPQVTDDLQTAVILALTKLRDPKVPELLLRGWKAYGPGRRGQVLDGLLTREEWLPAVLDAIEKKQIAAAEIDALRRQRLMTHKQESVRTRVAKLFAESISPDRQKVVEEYQPALKLTGDPARGAQVYVKICAQCHKLGDVGHIVGPDLASLGDKSPPFLLMRILDPNRAVEARYVSYTALLKNGQSVSGIIASETGNSVTLLAPEGKAQVILRSDLEELVSTGKVLMPEGLEKEIKHQDMADLIAYVRASGPILKRKEFDGNTPAVVKARNDGSFVLSAPEAEIYGKTLVLEKRYGNLGFWQSEDDHAIWTVEIGKAGKYAVRLDYACDDPSAGKTFRIQTGTNELTGIVASTGSWDNYKGAAVGEIVLATGQQRITFRSAGPLSGPLIDLRSIRLLPVK